jgi:hypothetical protein
VLHRQAVERREFAGEEAIVALNADEIGVRISSYKPFVASFACECAFFIRALSLQGRSFGHYDENACKCLRFLVIVHAIC